MGNEPDEKNGNKQGLAIGLGAVALQQINIGALAEAEHNLHRSIDLCRETDDKFQEASGHSRLARIFIPRGLWGEAEQEISTFLDIAIQDRNLQMQGAAWAIRSQRSLLMARDVFGNNQSQIENLKLSIEYAQRALELADETTRTWQPFPRDYVRAYWLFGSAYRANSGLTLAEENLSKALNLCRQINFSKSQICRSNG